MDEQELEKIYLCEGKASEKRQADYIEKKNLKMPPEQAVCACGLQALNQTPITRGVWRYMLFTYMYTSKALRIKNPLPRTSWHIEIVSN